MTLEEAYKLLKPDVTDEYVAKAKEYLKMMELFNLEESMAKEVKRALKITEACEVACECIKKCMEMEDDGK